MNDVDSSLEFLRWLYPRGPWMLTAIYQDQNQPTRTDTWKPGGEGQVRQWIKKHNDEQWNIYYSVNRAIREMDKKAERADIAEMVFLHVDIDPRDNHNFESERQRIAEIFASKMPPGLPPPSAIIDSGGGYNALWRLEVPIPIADPNLTTKEIEARYEEAKRYNLQLEILLGGDNCHNIDRILRLPGTTNWPNPKKRAKGRVPVQSRLVYAKIDAHPISKFIPAPTQQTKSGGTSLGGSVKVTISGNVQRLQNVTELGSSVSDEVKKIIVQGHDPDDPNKFGSSRSEWLFFVCCELVRANIPNETIYAVITDPSFRISASILDKGGNTERYALRQIQRAQENAIHPALRELNEKHAVIANIGGKCRIMEDVFDPAMERRVLTLQSFDDFKARYMHLKVEIGQDTKGQPRSVPMGQWWSSHPNRRQFETIVFVPGKEVPDAYNLWNGFACAAIPGDKHEIFLAHVKENVCGGVEEYYRYLVCWMAKTVQSPAQQGQTAVVLRGEMGAGKGTVAKIFGSLWGRHYLYINNSQHLVGQFNAHLRDAVFVFADEAFYAGDKKHESTLKSLITEDVITTEAKHVNMAPSKNYVHLMMASNANWVVPVGLNDRRFFVLDVKDTRTKNLDWWKKFYDSMDDGGRENLLYYLLTLDLSKYDVRQIPQTEGLRAQKMLSLSIEQDWWFQKLESGIMMQGHVDWDAPVFKDDLMEDYFEYAKKVGLAKRATTTQIAAFLRTVCPLTFPRSRQRTKQYEDKWGTKKIERAYAFEFPTLKECRDWWDKKYGGPYDWPVIEPIVEQVEKEPF